MSQQDEDFPDLLLLLTADCPLGVWGILRWWKDNYILTQLIHKCNSCTDLAHKAPQADPL